MITLTIACPLKEHSDDSVNHCKTLVVECILKEIEDILQECIHIYEFNWYILLNIYV